MRTTAHRRAPHAPASQTHNTEEATRPIWPRSRPSPTQRAPARPPLQFSFSLVWSIGAITDLEGRVGFNSFFRTFLETEEYLNEVKSVKTALELKKWSKPEFPGKKEWMKMAIPFPRNNSIYDYCYDANEKVWKMWMDTLPKFSIHT